MCGLAGIITNNTISTYELDIFNQMLLAGVFRGFDSTGVMSVGERGSEIFRSKLAGHDLFSDPRYNKWLSSDNVKASRALMVHHRWATSGGVAQKGVSTVHPFTHGKIALMMNGTVKDRTTLPDYKDFTSKVDSDNVAYAVNKLGIAETLRTVDSPYALTWYDGTDNSVNLIRNSDRPLYIAKVGPLWAYASEKDMLLWILGRKYKPVYSESFELIEGQQLKFTWTANGQVEMERIQRELFKPKPIVNYSSHSKRGNFAGWMGYDDYDDDSYGNVIFTGKKSDTTIITTAGPQADKKEIVIVEQTPIAKAINSTPPSLYKDKIKQVEELFKSHKFSKKLKDEIDFIPYHFVPYGVDKNLGCLRGIAVNTDYAEVSVHCYDAKRAEDVIDKEIVLTATIAHATEDCYKGDQGTMVSKVLHLFLTDCQEAA